ncbi:MAG TPA: class III extradiol ring-cleavage dioxygenase [Candidatus Polarisedimenticolia bacterium]|nr:class III extradiol ring-cleavage dioxygenase [Candidatus Polarisedimenticolia bacterium]
MTTQATDQAVEDRNPLPAIFVSHGSPAVALDDDDYTRALRRIAAIAPTPRAIVVVSAHWQSAAPLRVTGAARPESIYDFGGFPEVLYGLTYPCPGAPDLAASIVESLAGAGLPAVLDPRRGLDHGAWIPLRFVYPEAAIPVVQVSLPRAADPDLLMRMGGALAPLRRRGILLLGSGGVVHNLERVAFENKGAPVDPWARAFDDWFRDRLEARDFAAITAFRGTAPHHDLAVPTSEHFDPIHFVLGMAEADERAIHLYEGFQHANLSMRCFALGR